MTPSQNMRVLNSAAHAIGESATRSLGVARRPRGHLPTSIDIDKTLEYEVTHSKICPADPTGEPLGPPPQTCGRPFVLLGLEAALAGMRLTGDRHDAAAAKAA
jgi:hypothetical protein